MMDHFQSIVPTVSFFWWSSSYPFPTGRPPMEALWPLSERGQVTQVICFSERLHVCTCVRESSVLFHSCQKEKLHKILKNVRISDILYHREERRDKRHPYSLCLNLIMKTRSLLFRLRSRLECQRFSTLSFFLDKAPL